MAVGVGTMTGEVGVWVGASVAEPVGCLVKVGVGVRVWVGAGVDVAA